MNHRKNCMDVLDEICSNKNQIKSLDEYIYNHTKNNENEYYIQMRKIIFAFKKNPDLLKKVNNNIIILPSLDDENLFDIKIDRQLKEVCWAQKIEEKFSNLFVTGHKCSYCKSKKVISETLQTRSADEAQTVFLKCLECGKKLRIS